MRAFIDFDGVLFDIARHKREYFRLFERFGVSQHEARQAYEEMKKVIGRDDQRYYVARFQAQHPGFPVAQALRMIYAFKGKSAPCVYKEARPFLLALQNIGFELHLITTGSREFQMKKCETSGLMKFFCKIHLLEQDEKGRLLRKIAEPRGLSVFLDDKASVADDVKKYAPRVMVFQIARHSGDPRSGKADVVASNLREALRYIRHRTKDLKLCAE